MLETTATADDFGPAGHQFAGETVDKRFGGVPHGGQLRAAQGDLVQYGGQIGFIGRRFGTEGGPGKSPLPDQIFGQSGQNGLMVLNADFLEPIQVGIEGLAFYSRLT
ncbi:MAG: hypothetical protein KF760_22830 [Candidatus Eremiobacteraeota bacterium]|nr:hypothetical protein [Candidatus Eremiobacteraeota bacterium]MCW5870202.1 hypothetical protein [Candidatus Eremiobacteraeota bacterium]